MLTLGLNRNSVVYYVYTPITHNYSVVNNRPRRKANNTKKGKKPIKKTTKKTDKQNKKRLIKPKSTIDRERWYCLACKEERIADMRQCVECHKWYHEDCVGLTKSDLDAFVCPNFQEN